jgi:phosphoglycolate phosphatase
VTSGRPQSFRQFRLIAFDLDGTLIDSRRDIADAANALLADCGGAPLPAERIGRMVGDGAATLVARAFEASGLERPPDALPRFLAIYATRLTDHTRPYAGMDDVLTVLGRRATLAVLTNKPLAATRTILARLDLARHFEPSLVLGGDGPLPRKPDPSGLRQLMLATGADGTATVLVGDSIIDWRTAHATPAAACMARYGFGFEDFPLDTLGAEDLLVDSPAGLLRL